MCVVQQERCALNSGGRFLLPGVIVNPIVPPYIFNNQVYGFLVSTSFHGFYSVRFIIYYVYISESRK